MIVCCECKNELSKLDYENRSNIQCDKCGKVFRVVDGIPCFDENNLVNDYFFTEDALKTLYSVEDKHFLHIIRRNVILDLVKKYIKNGDSILEVGCGNGEISNFLIKNGYNVHCAEIFLAGLRICKSRFKSKLFQVNLNSNPFIDEYNAIIAIDVLEHIDDDIKAIEGIRSSLKQNGILIVFVPAHMFLWSEKDVSDKHKRRYSKNELIQKVEESGFEILKISSFITILFPLMVIVRLINRLIGKLQIKAQKVDEENINPIVNFLLLQVMKLERQLLKYIDLPFGGSVMLVAQKIN